MKYKEIASKKKVKKKSNSKVKRDNDPTSITPPTDDRPTEDNSNLIYVGGIAGYSEGVQKGKSFKQMKEDSFIARNRTTSR